MNLSISEDMTTILFYLCFVSGYFHVCSANSNCGKFFYFHFTYIVYYVFNLSDRNILYVGLLNRRLFVKLHFVISNL